MFVPAAPIEAGRSPARRARRARTEMAGWSPVARAGPGRGVLAGGPCRSDAAPAIASTSARARGRRRPPGGAARSEPSPASEGHIVRITCLSAACRSRRGGQSPPRRTESARWGPAGPGRRTGRPARAWRIRRPRSRSPTCEDGWPDARGCRSRSRGARSRRGGRRSRRPPIGRSFQADRDRALGVADGGDRFRCRAARRPHRVVWADRRVMGALRARDDGGRCPAEPDGIHGAAAWNGGAVSIDGDRHPSAGLGRALS